MARMSDEEKQTRVAEAYQRLVGLEAKCDNIEKKYGHVPEQVVKELQSAQVDYAVAKDDLCDPHV